MYIVNTSFFVDPAANDSWLAIINDKYIPFLEQNGYRIIAFSKILSNEAAAHYTYSLMVDCEDIPAYSRLTEELFDEYRTLADVMFGQRVTWFTTLMKKMEHKPASADE